MSPELRYLGLGLGLWLVVQAAQAWYRPRHIEVSAVQIASVTGRSSWPQSLRTQWEPLLREQAVLVREARNAGLAGAPEIRARLTQLGVDPTAAQAADLLEADPVARGWLAAAMRRRLRAQAPVPEPTTADLQAHLDTHAERFARPARWSLEHRYARDAAMRRRLQAAAADARPMPAGHPFPAGARFAGLREDEIAQRFGATIARKVSTIATADGTWHGPWPSAQGWHWIRILEVLPAQPPQLDAVREQVRALWTRAQEDAWLARELERRADRYWITVRWPD